jgi:hypothetical protein
MLNAIILSVIMHCCYFAQYRDFVIAQSVIMLNAIMVSVIMQYCYFAQYGYFKCDCAECR